MSPCGYITKTNLIGVGPCNNPCYEGNGSTAFIGYNDSRRTAFGNHAFVAVASTEDHIADACAGPHLVSETVKGYIAAAVQEAGTGPNQTTLYDDTGGFSRSGTAKNVGDCMGVTSINRGVPSHAELKAAEPTNEVASAMKMASHTSWSNSTSINVNLPAIHSYVSSSALPILDHPHDVSPYGSEIHYTLSSLTITDFHQPRDPLIPSPRAYIPTVPLVQILPPPFGDFRTRPW